MLKVTTLLKPVPYPDIDKDERDEIEKEIECLENDIKDLRKSYRDWVYSDRLINLMELTGVEPGECSIRVGHVLRLISVSISNKSDGSLCNDFEIYGEISVPDDKNNIFYLYKCLPDNPDFVSPDWNYLFLNGCHIAPVRGGGEVKVSPSNKDSCRIIFDVEYDVGKSIDDEEKLTLKCVGEDGYCALMEFTKIQFTVIANVEMFLCYDPPPTGDELQKLMEQLKFLKLAKSCVSTDDSDPVEMDHGETNGFGQSRSVFAVPVLSPQLEVKIELFSGGLKVADETLKVHCNGISSPLRRLQYPCIHKSYSFGMDVEWLHHEDLFECSWWAEELNVDWSRDALPMFLNPCLY